MAGHPVHRMKCATDRALLTLATQVPLHPPTDRAVFYAEDEGMRRAAKFVESDRTYTRLDDLLAQTPQGRRLWSDLTKGGRNWQHIETVWWELSWRLARAARGVVNVFGPARFVEDRPLEEFRHKYSTGSFANTVFEIVELPELEANEHVTKILFNGRPFS